MLTRFIARLGLLHQTHSCNHFIKLTTVSVILASILVTTAKDQTNQLQVKSHAEATNYEETSRYEDVLRFLTELQQQSPLMRLEMFGRSQEGRALPLAILSDPPVAQPREALESGKLVLLILANIHAGEVEGKEAAQNLARRLLIGDLQPLLRKLIVLIVPIYNADGNERISLTNRVPQNGPIGGVGQRENAQGLDLNRDFIKLEAPETRALIELFNHWDPQLTVDLHTTDGSYHGYHLTYSFPLNPSISGPLTDYHREKMMPALGKAMLTRHRFRTYYYGNFQNEPAGATNSARRAWFAFSPQPRVGVNYLGFRNRLCILSEAYSYLDFRRRIEVTEAFTEEIMKYAAAHKTEIRRLTRRADEQVIRRGSVGPPLEFGVEYRPKALSEPVKILVGEVTKVKNPRSGRFMTAMVEDKFTPVKMRDYGMFEATRAVPAGSGYLFSRDQGTRVMLEKLFQHGIAVEELITPATLEVERFRIEGVEKAPKPFEGHHASSMAGHYERARVAFPEGTLLVRTSQPLGLLAAYLLEPESDDGLVTWNFLDSLLEPGKDYPVCKLIQNANLAARVVKQ